MKTTRMQYDFLVVGAGFAGSVMAAALSNSGFRVCLVEKNKHPRFAIGESSTPIADMILRDLADTYQLPFLRKISRYGEWQRSYPDVTCGIKRGFSYYYHRKGEPFQSSRNHEHELLVAASVDDDNSDTNWLRSDVDYFLTEEAKKCGVDFYEQTRIIDVVRQPGKKWLVNAVKESDFQMECSWMIDATGSSDFSETFFGTESSSDGFETNSMAIYTHFMKAEKWQDYLERNKFHTDDYPYNPDLSALHHIIDEGWIWMLRFNNDLLSAGILLDETHSNTDLPGDADEAWNSVLEHYPSLHALFKYMDVAQMPGRIIRTGRLQRKLNRIYGDGWACLNHTSGFVDPLHSTGIAFSLCGIEKLLRIFTGSSRVSVQKELKSFQNHFFNEMHFMDLLVSSCYQSRWNFRLFTAAVMLYFTASIAYEQLRLNGEKPVTFLCSGRMELFDVIQTSHQEIKSLNKNSSPILVEKVIQNIRSRISPFNNIGLMDSAKKNMYHHTAVEIL
jgi:tetracycline 7-halogenase / FADH2 O2-dependent halogenase